MPNKDNIKNDNNKRQKKIKLSKLKCLRCGHEWTPRIEKVTFCPKCTSYLWNVPK